LEADIAETKKTREALELHANQLRADHLDLDRLGEEARRSLNVSYTNEIVIWLDETP
jgi:cell division protein FtsB